MTVAPGKDVDGRVGLLDHHVEPGGQANGVTDDATNGDLVGNDGDGVRYGVSAKGGSKGCDAPGLTLRQGLAARDADVGRVLPPRIEERRVFVDQHGPELAFEFTLVQFSDALQPADGQLV